MGCWNETCGISHLAIHAGEPVRFLPIVQNPFTYKRLSGHSNNPAPSALSGQSGCYLTTFWTTICYPLRGVYNDYGSIENIPDKSKQDLAELAQFLHVFRAHTIPLKLGDNEYHDPATTDLDLPRILDCLQEGRIWFSYQSGLPDYSPVIVPVSWMMIKEHVWQSLLALDFCEIDSLWQYLLEQGREKPPTVESLKRAYDASVVKAGNAKSELELMILEIRSTRSPAFNEPLYRAPIILRELSDHHEHMTQVAAELDHVVTILSYLRIALAPTIGSGSQGENLAVWKSVTKSWIKAETAAEKRRNRE